MGFPLVLFKPPFSYVPCLFSSLQMQPFVPSWTRTPPSPLFLYPSPSISCVSFIPVLRPSALHPLLCGNYVSFVLRTWSWGGTRIFFFKQKQQVFLTAEPSLAPPVFYSDFYVEGYVKGIFIHTI